MSSHALPLCVDLDGTLARTDLLAESLLVLLKKNPLYLFMCVVWLMRGKGYLKDQIAKRVTIDVGILPYNDRLVAYLRTEQQSGRELYLCTASNEQFAEQIAAHFGIFSGVMASNGEFNLRGNNKASALAGRFGEQGFDYCGNDMADVPVWKRAHAAIVVGNQKIAAAARKVNQQIILFDEVKPPLRVVLQATRVYQWCKNTLVFLPLLAAHQFTNATAVLNATIAFFAFSLCASSVYLVNDMLDLDADRRHIRKRNRPFASGKLPLSFGVALTAVLLTLTAILTTFLPPKFVLVLGLYFALTLAYSFVLKRLMLVDVFSLATLYTARIVAGGAAGQIPLSYWLILFSVSIFLSLAMVKRYAELNVILKEGKSAAAGRGYITQDLAILQSFGTAAGYTAALVLALYLNSPEVQLMYRHQEGLWALFGLMLFWVSRVWIMAFRGKMHDDPIVFALKDKVSLCVLTACVVSIVLAA
ncbi:4-hydroxybenzoate polyprenyltransferase [Paraburkholderia sp. RAU2J]|uniref:UbiA family prenyltransferase n=1 Tax=Paraburkholderia sp. RAU2J TaxID=1938810 RepID=UPI000EAC6988|nr:UbiA family prenyltransferase [Paraburkholderia sp. RAU2J]RKT26199.1 4-hydroxybenzoate polyprenyltransferase [Paraburkholderia sp. RAU2J]